MRQLQIQQRAELFPLLDKFFPDWRTVEVEFTDTEVILRKAETDVVQKTHGTIKIKDKELIKRIAESEEFSAYQ